MKWYKVVWAKVKIFAKEILNIATNFLCPVMALICSVCELTQMPIQITSGVKKAEYWLFNACGTATQIYSLVEKTESEIAGKKE